jgi:hypothetical protein
MYKGDKKMIENLFLKQRTLSLFIFCSLSGLCFHYFFYGKMVGISVLLFTILLYVIYFTQYPDLVKKQRKLSWFFLSVVLLIATTFVLFSNEMFRFFNVVILPMLFLYHTFLLKKGNRGEWAKPIMIARLGSAISDMFKILFGSFSFIGQQTKRGVDQRKYELVKNIVIGILISTPILFFVTFLLMSSDVHFSTMIIRIPIWFMKLSLGSILLQALLIIIVTLCLFSYFLSLQLDTNLEIEEDDSRKKRLYNLTIVGTVLLLINFVYVLYMFSQFSYFFDVNPASSSNSYSYATYARKGFAELTVVSVINFSILLTVLHHTNLITTISKIFIQGLLSLLVSFTGFILISAIYRLSLYEAAYGYTYSRVLAHSFMILLIIMLVIAFLRIWMKMLPLLKAYVILLACFYVLLNYLNIDVMIAEQNMERYEKTGKIDMEYMELLSDDVIPYLVQLQEETGRKSEFVTYRLEKVVGSYDDWPEWNWSSHKAYRFLIERKGEH